MWTGHLQGLCSPSEKIVFSKKNWELSKSGKFQKASDEGDTKTLLQLERNGTSRDRWKGKNFPRNSGKIPGFGKNPNESTIRSHLTHKFS